MKHVVIFAASFVALFVGGCTQMQQQPATQPTTAAPASAQSNAGQFRNLQVLPRDIPREQLLATMRTFTRGLGVRCNFCHVVTATTPKEELDFPSDANDHKRVARVMMRMTGEINQTWIPRAEAAEHHGEPQTAHAHAPSEQHDDAPQVVCWTCHRGKPEPDAMPAPAPAPAQ